MTYDIVPERPQDAALILPLLDHAFGPERQAKTVYRLREGLAPLAALSCVAVDRQAALLASLRFWPVLIGDAPAILLGPLAVDPELRGQGIGRALVRHGLGQAKALDHRLCLVVGEADYYEPFGFVNAGERGIVLPGPVDPQRFQVLAMADAALDGVSGLVARDTLRGRPSAPDPAISDRGQRAC